MVRSALVFLLAATSLAGALWWAPHVAEGEPHSLPAFPRPPPSRPVAVTRVSYGDALLTVDTRADREAVLAGTAAELFLEVAVTATDAAPPQKGIATLLVIDRSGSMAGEAIEQVRLGALQLLKGLDDDDRFALLSYGSDVNVDVPWTTTTGPGKAAVAAQVTELVEGVGTHLEAGLRKSVSLVQQLSSWDGPVRVILLSDGLANEGERRVDRLVAYGTQLRNLGATLSTLGLGTEFHAPLLGELATRGGGRYRYLSEAKDLGRLFDDERRHAAAVVAQNVTLRLDLASGVQLTDVHGALPEVAASSGSLHLGELAAGETRHVVLSLRFPVAIEGPQSLEFPPPTVTYRATAGSTTSLLSPADPLRMRVLHDAPAVAAGRIEDVSARVTLVQQQAALGRVLAGSSPRADEFALAALENAAAVLHRAAHEQSSALLAEEARRARAVVDQLKRAHDDATQGAEILQREQARVFELTR
ncbi:MAG: vWA domain-containing protein [Myxococcota bacterium]